MWSQFLKIHLWEATVKCINQNVSFCYFIALQCILADNLPLICCKYITQFASHVWKAALHFASNLENTVSQYLISLCGPATLFTAHQGVWIVSYIIELVQPKVCFHHVVIYTCATSWQFCRQNMRNVLKLVEHTN